MTTADRLRLPLDFDAAVLAEEVAGLTDADWILHFNTAIFEGRWAGVALRAAGGKSGQLYPDPMAADFANTEVLGRCPNLAAAVGQFRCPLNAVRLLTLDPGGIIREHRDYRLGYEDGEVRLHIPIVTNPLVEFVLDGRIVDLHAGECWYLNLNLPHRVANRSSEPRVHLVLDCVVDDWLASVMANAAAPAPR